MDIVLFLINSIFIGAGLAMDAFSVCIANGLAETGLSGGRRIKMAGVFASFQALMPVIGWICVKTIANIFTGFNRYIPVIAFILLLYIGGKMIYEALKKKGVDEEGEIIISKGQLLVQGLATSIDALSVGFAISAYSLMGAVMTSLIIGTVTFFICLLGLSIGRKAGERFADKATVLGGVILICIGIEILIF